jgi:uncharacterized membrane protein
MSTPRTTDGVRPASRLAIWAGIVLLAVGLIGHLYAAHASGGSSVHYGHHVFGFFLILVVTGVIIALLGRFFWRSRPDLTVLIIGAVQALFGVLVAVD